MKFKSLKTKVLFWFSLLSLVILIVFGFSFYYFFEKSLLLTIQNELYTQSVYIKEHINNKAWGKIRHKFPFAILEDNKIVYKTKKFELKNLSTVLNSKKIFKVINYGEYQDAIYIQKIKKPFSSTILVLKKEIDNRLEDIVSTMSILIPLLLLLLIIIANKMLNQIIFPLRNINKIAKTISVNDFNQKIPLSNNEDEIRELIQTFNEMMGRLEEGVAKIKRFNSDVSHELKTPLTVINGQIELSFKKERDKEYYKNSLENIKLESKKIENLVDELLLLSKYSKDNLKDNFVNCDFNAILLEVLEKYLPIAEEKNIILEIEKFEKTTKKANFALISVIFSNLIDNAIKYTPKYKNIYISLYQDDKIHFIIKDEGIGIPKDKLSLVTDRFYRVDESRNKKIKGFGLGLSIVKNSVELHGGTLFIDSTKGAGTTLHVEI